MKNTILSLIRHGLTFGGGYLLAKGLISEETLNALVPAIIGFIGAIWGATDEFLAEKKKEEAAATSGEDSAAGSE